MKKMHEFIMMEMNWYGMPNIWISPLLHSYRLKCTSKPWEKGMRLNWKYDATAAAVQIKRSTSARNIAPKNHIIRRWKDFRCRKYNYYVVASLCMRFYAGVDFLSLSHCGWQCGFSSLFRGVYKANDDIIYVNFPFKIMRSFRSMFYVAVIWEIQTEFRFVMDFLGSNIYSLDLMCSALFLSFALTQMETQSNENAGCMQIHIAASHFFSFTTERRCDRMPKRKSQVILRGMEQSKSGKVLALAKISKKKKSYKYQEMWIETYKKRENTSMCESSKELNEVIKNRCNQLVTGLFN